MILFMEVQLLRNIVATGHIEREQLKREIMEAFPASNLKRVYGNGIDQRMTILLKSYESTGKEVELFCRLKGFWSNPKKLKMQLVRWLYKNGMSTMDANLLADKYIPEVKKAYSTTPVQNTYSGVCATRPKTIEREVINRMIGIADQRHQIENPIH